jgi:hypothetical protein
MNGRGRAMQKRRRLKQTLSLQDRHAAFAGELSENAAGMLRGPERDDLLKRAGQADTALDLSGSMSLLKQSGR